MGLVKNPSWRSLVERYIASSIGPLEGWPDSYTAWAHDAMIELRVAIRAEEARQDRVARERGKSGTAPPGPRWADNRTSGGTR